MTEITRKIDQFAQGPEILAYAVAGLTPEQERARPGPGAWSIAELVAHLADSDAVAVDRMKRVIAEDNPILLAYDQDAWIARLDSQSMPVAEGVQLFALDRTRMARILRNRPESDFAREGRHTETGRKTLSMLVTLFVEHLDYHLKFLYDKRRNLNAAIEPRYVAGAPSEHSS